MKKLLLMGCGVFLAQFSVVKAQASMNFDGVNDHISATNPPISGNAARTVEAWIKTTKNSLPPNQSGDGQSVIVDWGITATSARFTFNILNNNAIRLEVQGNGIYGMIPVNDGNWHHVAVTYDPAASPTVHLYVDGVLDTAGNLTVPVNTSSSGMFYIGQRVDGVNLFEGSIDEVRVWNYARNPNQLVNDMNKEFCSAQTGLVAYYKFNEGSPAGTNTGITTINDYSGSNHNGTVNNMTLTGATSNFDNPATLTLTTIDNTLTQNNEMLSANQAGASYQWYDCGTNTAISGATSQTYTATSNGTYSVLVNLNGCMSMSSCATVSNLGTSEVSRKKSVMVYPNPSSGEFTIVSPATSETKIAVYDAAGKLILKEIGSKESTINIEASNGIYFLQVENEKGEVENVKLIKK